MKWAAIVNPAAGGGRGHALALSAAERLRGNGFEVEIHETTKAGDATRFARELASTPIDGILAMGGDGTLFEVVNGLLPSSGKVPILATFPIGTGNSFLRDFTENGHEYAIDSIVKKRRRKCDVLRLTHREGTIYFINILSIGFAAEVAVLRNKAFRAFGEFGYTLATLVKLLFLSPHYLPMTVDGTNDAGETTFISINNTKFTGGKMMMAPKANPTDGYADLIRVAPMRRLELLRAFPRIFQGTHIELPQVTERKVRNIDFKYERPVAVMIDGETMFLHPTRMEVLPGAIEVAV